MCKQIHTIHQNTTPPEPCHPFLPCTCAISHSRNTADFRIHFLDCHRRGMERLSPFSWRCCKCSRHGFAAAKGQNQETTTPQALRCQLQCQGLQPKRHGDFPRSIDGSLPSPLVRCLPAWPCFSCAPELFNRCNVILLWSHPRPIYHIVGLLV